jgi:hypothetical protein
MPDMDIKYRRMVANELLRGTPVETIPDVLTARLKAGLQQTVDEAMAIRDTQGITAAVQWINQSE